MAPFRGRGRGRGGGRVAKPTGRLARSGIRTRGGYRKFDSQRIKHVDASDSEEEVQEVEEEEREDGSELSDEEIEEDMPKVKAYSTLMQAFQPTIDENARRRKRRKLSLDGEAGVGGEDDRQVDLNEAGGDASSGEDEGEEEEARAMFNGANGTAEAEDEVEDAASDPYEAHYAMLDDDVSMRLNDVRTEKQPFGGTGTLHISVPSCVTGTPSNKRGPRSTAELPLKKRLATSSAKELSTLDDLQQTLVPCTFNYQDLLLPIRTPDNAASLRTLSCLHILNHVLKGRDKVLKNTARLAASNEPDSLDVRDQGFTRPKVLILTETRQMAYNFGQTIINLFQPDQVENRQRFKDSFSAPIDEDSTMPEDYHELFAGNNDNSFLTSLKFTRKTLKFFSAFYTSDVILASPLGLRRILESEDKKKQDHDFLSSIEVVIVDQADAMQMQSWENVETVFKHLNLQPQSSHGTDFSRVRSWYLDGNAKFLRQTIIFSAYLTAEMNHLFTTHMQNLAGKVKLLPHYDGALTSPALAGLGIKQTFSRFDSPSPSSDPDARFTYFTTAVLPSLLRLPKPSEGGQGILIFIPSYFDFVRLRNYFATSSTTSNISFGAIHDYTSIHDQRRTRSHFLSGRYSFLLYTQRAHHFFRLRIRGVRRVVCYGIPENPNFYEEIVGGMLGGSVGEGRLGAGEAAARTCFSRWEALQLERVVGTGRVRGMLVGRGDVFDFV